MDPVVERTCKRNAEERKAARERASKIEQVAQLVRGEILLPRPRTLVRVWSLLRSALVGP